MPNFSVGSRIPQTRCSARQAGPAVLLALALLGAGASPARADVVIEALFHVSSVESKLLGQDRSRFDAQQYRLFQQTQIALAKSNIVLNAALRDPATASMPILESVSDPAEWLAGRLEVDFLNGSEILSIRMRGEESEASDLKHLVDDVAKAYEKEVVYNEKQRQLVLRDAKARVVTGLQVELQEKMGDLQALKNDLDEHSSESVEFQLKQMDVDVLAGVYRQLLRSLEFDDANFNASERIRLIQPAVVRQE